MSRVIVLVELLDEHRHPRQRERILLDDENRTITIGRSLEADIVLDDEHVAPLHATLELNADGKIVATDLGSLNGTWVAGRNYRTAEKAALVDDTMTVGDTTLRVRTSLTPPAPEKLHHPPVASLLRRPAVIALLGSIAVTVQTIHGVWVSAPSDLEIAMASAIALAAAMFVGWVAVWAVISRISVGSWRWQRHAAIAFGVSALTSIAETALDMGWFSLALPIWPSRAHWVYIASLAALIYFHSLYAASGRANRKAIIASALTLLLCSGGMWLWGRFETRDVDHIAAKHDIFPPVLRLASARDAATFFNDAKQLRDAADAKRDALPVEDADSADD